MNPNFDRNRARGAMYGLACGDSLGSYFEFTYPTNPAKYPKLMPYSVKMTGGGTWGVQAGQVTDDTHMALCLALTLANPKGYTETEAAERYLAWREHTFDIGGLTASSLSSYRSTGRARWNGYHAWMGRSAGNGSLMRTAPIGAAVEDLNQLINISMIDSAITHFDPRCQIACAAYNAGIAEAVWRKPNPLNDLQALRKQMLFVIENVVVRAGIRFQSMFPALADHGKDAVTELLSDCDAARLENPSIYGEEDSSVTISGGGSGYVRTAFRLALYKLMSATDYRSGISDIACRGGDSDTNAAIAGGLLGALFGYDAIPPEWRSAVHQALQGRPVAKNFINKFFSRGEKPAKDNSFQRSFSPALRDLYHPKQFEVLLRQLDTGTPIGYSPPPAPPSDHTSTSN